MTLYKELFFSKIDILHYVFCNFVFISFNWVSR